MAALTAVAVICVAVLSVCNHFWSLNDGEESGFGVPEKARAMLIEMTGGTDFSVIDAEALIAGTTVTDVYRVKAGGNRVGALVFRCTQNVATYGTVTVLVAIDISDGAVFAVKVYESKQTGTALLYTEVFTNPALMNRFIGAKTPGDIIGSNRDIKEAVGSNATYSTGGVVNAVKAALALYNEKGEALRNAPDKTGEGEMPPPLEVDAVMWAALKTLFGPDTSDSFKIIKAWEDDGIVLYLTAEGNLALATLSEERALTSWLLLKRAAAVAVDVLGNLAKAAPVYYDHAYEGFEVTIGNDWTAFPPDIVGTHATASDVMYKEHVQRIVAFHSGEGADYFAQIDRDLNNYTGGA